MSHQLCNKCGHQGRLLEGAIQSSFVDYYRCDHCGHVWARDKDNPDAPRRDITVDPKDTAA